MPPSNCDIQFRQAESPFFTGYYRNGPRPEIEGGVLVKQYNFPNNQAPADSDWFGFTNSGGTLDYSNGTVRGVYPAGATDSVVGVSIRNLADLLDEGEVYVEFDARIVGAEAQQGCKFIKIFNNTADPQNNYANVTFGTNYTGLDDGGIISINYGDGTGVTNDTVNGIDLSDGTLVGNTQDPGRAPSPVIEVPNGIFASEDWGPDVWHHFRIKMKFNTGTTAENEQPDGELYLEIDGEVYCNVTGIFNRHYSNDRGIATVALFGVTQGNVPGMTIDYDNIKISKGGFVDQTFTPLVAENFADGVVNDPYTNGVWANSIYSDARSASGTQSMLMTIDGGQPPLTCGGSSYFGGRQPFPIEIPEGYTVWYRMKLFIPSTLSWGYLYDNTAGDVAEAAQCGIGSEDCDGNVWTKFLRLSRSTGSIGRIYLQPSAARRQIDRPSNGMRLVAEASQSDYLDVFDDQFQFPVDQWCDVQIAINIQSDTTGWMRFWIDGNYAGEMRDIITENALDEWAFGTHWNGVQYTDGQANRSEIWMDEVIVATNYPGYGVPTGRDSGGRPYIDPNTLVDDLVFSLTNPDYELTNDFSEALDPLIYTKANYVTSPFDDNGEDVMSANYAPEGLQGGTHCNSEVEISLPVNAVQVLVKFREYIPASYTSANVSNQKTVGFWSGAYGIVNANIAVTSECWPISGEDTNGYPSIYTGNDGVNYGHYYVPDEDKLPLWVAGDGNWHDVWVLLELAEQSGDYGRYRIWRDKELIVDSDNPNYSGYMEGVSARETIHYSTRGNFIDTVRLFGWANSADGTNPAFAGTMHFLYDDLVVQANTTFKPVNGIPSEA